MSVCRMTELAYKYFFKTLNAQADRLMQSTEVHQELNTDTQHPHLTLYIAAAK